MPKRSYAEQITDAQVMLAGLQGNADRVARRGIDEQFLTQMDADTAEAVSLNNRQEKLKADLKSLTDELDAKLAALGKQVSESRKIVKMDFPQSQWKEFGITDTR